MNYAPTKLSIVYIFIITSNINLLFYNLWIIWTRSEWYNNTRTSNGCERALLSPSLSLSLSIQQRRYASYPGHSHLKCRCHYSLKNYKVRSKIKSFNCCDINNSLEPLLSVDIYRLWLSGYRARSSKARLALSILGKYSLLI